MNHRDHEDGATDHRRFIEPDDGSPEASTSGGGRSSISSAGVFHWSRGDFLDDDVVQSVRGQEQYSSFDGETGNKFFRCAGEAAAAGSSWKFVDHLVGRGSCCAYSPSSLLPARGDGDLNDYVD